MTHRVAVVNENSGGGTKLLFNAKLHNDLVKYKNHTLDTSLAYPCDVIYILHYFSNSVFILIAL